MCHRSLPAAAHSSSCARRRDNFAQPLQFDCVTRTIACRATPRRAALRSAPSTLARTRPRLRPSSVLAPSTELSNRGGNRAPWPSCSAMSSITHTYRLDSSDAALRGHSTLATQPDERQRRQDTLSAAQTTGTHRKARLTTSSAATAATATAATATMTAATATTAAAQCPPRGRPSVHTLRCVTQEQTEVLARIYIFSAPCACERQNIHHTSSISTFSTELAVNTPHLTDTATVHSHFMFAESTTVAFASSAALTVLTAAAAALPRMSSGFPAAPFT